MHTKQTSKDKYNNNFKFGAQNFRTTFCWTEKRRRQSNEMYLWKRPGSGGLLDFLSKIFIAFSQNIYKNSLTETCYKPRESHSKTLPVRL
jgi:hypothetical protein